MARREPHLPESFIRLDPGREPDLVAVGPVPAAAARVVAIERTAGAEGADLGGEAFERALDEQRPWRDIEIGLGAPELLAQSADLLRSEGPLGERKNDVAHRVRDGAAC